MTDLLTLEQVQGIGSVLFAAILTSIAFAIAFRNHYFVFPPRENFYRINFIDCITFCLLFLFLHFVFSIIFSSFAGSGLKSGWMNLLALGGNFLAFGICFWFQKEKIKHFFTSSEIGFDFLIGLLTWLIAFPSALLVSQINALIFTGFLGIPLENQTVVQHMKNILEDPILFPLTAIAIIFVVPLIEEILFRGYLQTWLRGWIGKIGAIAVSGFVFSAFHFSASQGISNINIVTTLFSLSLFLGFIRERQGNLWSSFALHSTFNAVSVGMLLFSF